MGSVKFKISEQTIGKTNYAIHCQIRIIGKGSILRGGHGDYHTSKKFQVDLWQTVPRIAGLSGLRIKLPNMIRYHHRPIFGFDKKDEIRKFVEELRKKLGTKNNRLVIVDDDLEIFQ